MVACRKNRTVLSGLLFFILNIVLILQLLPIGDAIIAERYTYLSYLGLFWALAYGIEYLIQKSEKLRPVIIVICCCYIITLSYLCYQRTQVWKDSLSLWQDELQKYTNVPVAWNNMGMIREADNDAKDAKECFNSAISLDPDYALAFANRSMAYTQLGLYDSAIHDDDKAIRMQPDNKAAHQNRGAAFALVGKTDSLTYRLRLVSGSLSKRPLCTY